MLIRINIKNTSLYLFLLTCTTMIGIRHILNIDSCSIPKFHVFVCHMLSIYILCKGVPFCIRPFNRGSFATLYCRENLLWWFFRWKQHLFLVKGRYWFSAVPTTYTYTHTYNTVRTITHNYIAKILHNIFNCSALNLDLLSPALTLVFAVKVLAASLPSD